MSSGQSSRVPDAIEPITAWKLWGVNVVGELFSVNYARSTSAGAIDPASEPRALVRFIPLDPVAHGDAAFAGRLENMAEIAEQMRRLYVWPGQERFEALCAGTLWRPEYGSHDDPAPSPDCRHGCGIYGAKDCRRLYEPEWFSYRYTTTVAFGRVKLWGPVEEAEHGWRARYAYPESLTVLTSDWLVCNSRPEFMGDLRGAQKAVLDEVAERYGVPVAASDGPVGRFAEPWAGALEWMEGLASGYR